MSNQGEHEHNRFDDSHTRGGIVAVCHYSDIYVF